MCKKKKTSRTVRFMSFLEALSGLDPLKNRVYYADAGIRSSLGQVEKE